MICGYIGLGQANSCFAENGPFSIHWEGWYHPSAEKAYHPSAEKGDSDKKKKILTNRVFYI